MTAATPPPSSGQQGSATPTVVWEHAAELALLEDEVAHRLTAPLRLRLTAILRAFQHRIPDRQPLTGFPAVRLMAELADALQRLPAPPADGFRAALADAYRLGGRQAAREGGFPARSLSAPPTAIDQAVQDAVAQAQAARDKAVSLAQATARVTPSTVLRIVGVAQREATGIEGTARTLINVQANTAIRETVLAHGSDMLWVAERDACQVCLALAGHLPDDDGLFDARASFGTPMSWVPPGGLTGPPRHPRCRCRLTPWSGDPGDPFGLPRALRREAERSILNGWALPSEPVSTRQRAAARLLGVVASHHGTTPSGWAVPAQVRDRTGRRLQRRTFTTERFPGR